MTEKSKSPGNTLTVIIINESPLNWGASPTYRSVRIRLTKRQQEANHIYIGKLNHRSNNIDWADFGRRAEELCQSLGRSYTIKNDLRKEAEP